MKFKSLFLLSWVVLVLEGCALDARNATSVEIQQAIKSESATTPYHRVWSAPPLLVSHFRTRFYGYDTVDYHLSASQSGQSSSPTLYHLKVDANYGGLPRHYDLAKSTNSSQYPAYKLRHETLRCQFFGDMQDACLYRDRLDFELSLAELEAGRHSGMTLTLASADNKEYEQIDLPPAYIDGFLAVIQSP